MPAVSICEGLMRKSAIGGNNNSIKNGQWRKTFSNSDWVPELKGRNIGLVGFGYIGRLVAQKLGWR